MLISQDDELAELITKLSKDSSNKAINIKEITSPNATNEISNGI